MKGDVNFLSANNIDCTIEDENGNKQRATLSIDGSLFNSLSFSKDAIKTTTYSDDAKVIGDSFVFEKNFTIPIGGSLEILIDYTTFVPAEGELGQIFIMPPILSTTSGPVQVHIYRGTDYTGGVEFDAVNVNTTNAKVTSGTTFTLGATGTDKGTEVLTYLVGTSATNQSSGGGSAQGITFFIRPNTGTTLFEIVNESGEEVIFHYGQDLFEI